MKLISLLLLIFFALLIGSCSRELPTSPENTTDKSGSLSLNIDKTTTPKDVVNVIAYLTRVNYDTLSGELNLLSSNSASISFEDVFAGTWHLKVDATNADNVVIYTGETDIQVVAGTIIQVNLTLFPVGQGKGNIYIFVNWGSNSRWVDYNLNPILTTEDNPSLPNQVSTCKIIYDNSIYKMWYLCTYSAGKTNVWYAESPDGIHWQNKFDHPVFTNGTPGSWDDYAVSPGFIIKNGAQYLMYYNGWQSTNGYRQIGLATSSDGINWERYQNPVLESDSSEYAKLGIVSVLKVNGLYYMYYSTNPIDYYDNMRINLATSSDGINWTKYYDNPILGPTEAWEGVGITYPSVIFDNNHFIMIYGNTDRTKFGIAYSDDGINWNKSSQPVFTLQDTQTQYEQINYPYLTKSGNEYRLYYTATPLNTYPKTILCLARSLNLN